jgi:hypothetical protein
MCQVEYFNEIGKKNNWFNDKLQWSIRKFRYYRKIIIRSMSPETSPALYSNQEQIQSGDIVRVRTKAEIQRTLDRWRKTKGCTFQVGMYHYCGQELKVFKKVDYFFDEVKQKTCKCNNIFLLEGACCDGTTAYVRKCDRNCFFFWQINWLEKVRSGQG